MDELLAKRLENLELALEELKQMIQPIQRYVELAEAAANSAANSAQSCILRVDSLQTRFEQLRQEHSHNHPGSIVPPSLTKKIGQ